MAEDRKTKTRISLLSRKRGTKWKYLNTYYGLRKLLSSLVEQDAPRDHGIRTRSARIKVFGPPYFTFLPFYFIGLIVTVKHRFRIRRKFDHKSLWKIFLKSKPLSIISNVLWFNFSFMIYFCFSFFFFNGFFKEWYMKIEMNTKYITK